MTIVGCHTQAYTRVDLQRQHIQILNRCNFITDDVYSQRSSYWIFAKESSVKNELLFVRNIRYLRFFFDKWFFLLSIFSIPLQTNQVKIIYAIISLQINFRTYKKFPLSNTTISKFPNWLSSPTDDHNNAFCKIKSQE